MASRTALLLLLAVLCAAFASGEIAKDCCLTVSNKHFPLKRIVSYELLEACSPRATVFITKLGRKLCVSHPDDEEWVKDHIKSLKKTK